MEHLQHPTPVPASTHHIRTHTDMHHCIYLLLLFYYVNATANTSLA